jgi:hypothetical protein
MSTDSEKISCLESMNAQLKRMISNAKLSGFTDDNKVVTQMKAVLAYQEEELKTFKAK